MFFTDMCVHVEKQRGKQRFFFLESNTSHRVTEGMMQPCCFLSPVSLTPPFLLTSLVGLCWAHPLLSKQKQKSGLLELFWLEQDVCVFSCVWLQAVCNSQSLSGKQEGPCGCQSRKNKQWTASCPVTHWIAGHFSFHLSSIYTYTALYCMCTLWGISIYCMALTMIKLNKAGGSLQLKY